MTDHTESCGRNTPVNNTLGAIMDRLDEKTVLDLHFTHDDAPRYSIPNPLATHPTVGKLKENQYLRDLPVEERNRYSTPYIPNGYDVYIPARFDMNEWKNARRTTTISE